MAQNQVTPLPPEVNNQINKDLKAWMEAQLRLKMDKAYIQKLLKIVETMKNPLIAAQMLMLAVQKEQGDKVGVLAAVDNLDSDIRTQFSDAQNELNQAIGSAQKGGSTKKETEAMKEFMKTLDGIEAFLKYEQALNKQDKGQIGGATIKTMLDAINSIKAQFGSTPKGIKTTAVSNLTDSNWNPGEKFHGVKRWGNWTQTGHHRGKVLRYANKQYQSSNVLTPAGKNPNFGNPTKMVQELNDWINSAKKNGTPSPQLKIIQDSLHTLIQSSSALSATTNTKLQFQTSQYKQFMGITNSLIQSYEKLIGSSVRNEKSN